MQTKSLLLWLHALAFVIHLVSGVLGYRLSLRGDPTVPVVASTFRYGNVSAGEPVIVPRPTTWCNVHLLLGQTSVEFTTASFHLLYWVNLKSPRADAFCRAWFANTPSANPLRWIEYAITATLMFLFGNLGVGLTDAAYFLKSMTTGVALQACGYAIELLDCKRKADVRHFKIYFYVIGNLLNLVSVVSLLYQVFASDSGSAKNLYIQNTVPFALWFQTFGLVAYQAFYKTGKFADPWFAEKWYVLLSLSTKVATVWGSYATSLDVLTQHGAYPRVGVDWNAVRLCAITVPFCVVFATAANDYFQALPTPARVGGRPPKNKPLHTLAL
jgi:hypothetical protein